MFVFDLESLGVESNSVILSMACIHFKPEYKQTPEQLRAEAFFCKFDVSDQVKRLDRKIDKDTVNWWKKQCDNVKKVSFTPNLKYDVPFEAGHAAMKEWVEHKNDPDCWVWARGGLDDVMLASMERACGVENIFSFNRWRDVRTAIDFLYHKKNGYCEVYYPGFDRNLHITKHNPIDDCVLDVMQLLYGEEPL